MSLLALQSVHPFTALISLPVLTFATVHRWDFVYALKYRKLQ